MTKGGTFVAITSLLLAIPLALIWIQLHLLSYLDAQAPVLEFLWLVLLSLVGSGLVLSLILGNALRSMKQKPGSMHKAIKAWKVRPSDPLPPIEAAEQHSGSDETILETHMIRREEILRNAGALVIVVAPAALVTLAFSLYMAYAAINGVPIHILLIAQAPILPFFAGVLLWTAAYVARHRVEVHPNAITVRGVFKKATFSNTTNTIIVLPIAGSGTTNTYFIDRPTGKRIATGMLNPDFMTRLSEGDPLMNNAIRIDAPRGDIAPYMPLIVTQPIFLQTIVFWYLVAAFPILVGTISLLSQYV